MARKHPLSLETGCWSHARHLRKPEGDPFSGGVVTITMTYAREDELYSQAGLLHNGGPPYPHALAPHQHTARHLQGHGSKLASPSCSKV